MAELTREEVARELLRLAAHYPEAGHNGTTIRIIAEDYHHDLVSEGVSPQNFREAVVEARKRTAFFPKVSDILKAHHEIVSRPQPASRVAGLIAETTRERSEEETALAKRNFAIIGRMARGEITQEQADDLMRQPISEAAA